MTRTRLPVVLATVLMTIAVGNAEAGPVQFQTSGSFIVGGTPIDTNGDGVTADLFITSGTSSQVGPFTNQTVAEWSFGAPTTCPSGTVLQGTLVPAGSGFVSRSNNGDLLFGTLVSGTNCFDGTTAHITASANYTGGTGRFTGATGSFTITATATLVAPGGFGSVVAEGNGTLNK